MLYYTGARSLLQTRGVKVYVCVSQTTTQLKAFVYKHRKLAMSRQENRLGAHATIKAVISNAVTDGRISPVYFLHTQLLKHIYAARALFSDYLL
jgi:hypothetical protein